MTSAQTASFQHEALTVSGFGLSLDYKVMRLTDVEMPLSSGHCLLFPGSLQLTYMPVIRTPQNLPPTLLPVDFPRCKWDGGVVGLKSFMDFSLPFA